MTSATRQPAEFTKNQNLTPGLAVRVLGKSEMRAPSVLFQKAMASVWDLHRPTVNWAGWQAGKRRAVRLKGRPALGKLEMRTRPGLPQRMTEAVASTVRLALRFPAGGELEACWAGVKSAVKAQAALLPPTEKSVVYRARLFQCSHSRSSQRSRSRRAPAQSREQVVLRRFL